jgi:hypothetical protein
MDLPRNRSRSPEYYRLRLNSRATFAQWSPILYPGLAWPSFSCNSHSTRSSYAYWLGYEFFVHVNSVLG